MSTTKKLVEWQTTYFGYSLITKSGPKPIGEVLSGKKLVCVYFSAHWCGPCRDFTPVLSEFYESLKNIDKNALEIIFVSSDGDQHSFSEYFDSMPWTAIPFDSPLRDHLGQRFGVRGIPTLVVLSASSGAIIDADARSTVASARGDIAKIQKKWHF